MGCIQSRINPILAEHLEFHTNTHLEIPTRGRVSATTASAQDQECSWRRSCQSRSENLMSQSQSLLEITESTHSRSSEKRSSTQLLRAASVSPQQCHRSCCAGQLCTAVQRQLDSTASTEKQGPRKSFKSLQNLILPFVSFSHFAQM